eukprot:13158160-Alexandrium_andersonii.AAC.1
MMTTPMGAQSTLNTVMPSSIGRSSHVHMQPIPKGSIASLTTCALGASNIRDRSTSMRARLAASRCTASRSHRCASTSTSTRPAAPRSGTSELLVRRCPHLLLAQHAAVA